MFFQLHDFLYKGFFGPVLELSYHSHDSCVKPLLRLSEQKFLSCSICLCMLVESEKALRTLEMMINLSKQQNLNIMIIKNSFNV